MNRPGPTDMSKQPRLSTNPMPTPPLPTDPGSTDTVQRTPWGQIAVFAVLALALAWAAALPLWLSGEGLNTPLMQVYSILMMLTPAVAALTLVLAKAQRGSRLRALGLTVTTKASRFVWFLVLALMLPLVFCLIAVPVGDLFGVLPTDYTGFSGFEQVTREQLNAAGMEELPVPVELMATLQIVNILVGALIINIIPALGEEIGGRGWLLPRLLPLGPWPAILLSGALWGIWHAPLLLLGYNYSTAPGWLSVLLMMGSCTVMGGVFGWLRLRGGSVWPAALAHSTLNAAAGVFILFIAADANVSPVHATDLGWTGWVAPGIFVTTVVWAGTFRAVRATKAHRPYRAS